MQCTVCRETVGVDVVSGSKVVGVVLELLWRTKGASRYARRSENTDWAFKQRRPPLPGHEDS